MQHHSKIPYIQLLALHLWSTVNVNNNCQRYGVLVYKTQFAFQKVAIIAVQGPPSDLRVLVPGLYSRSSESAVPIPLGSAIRKPPAPQLFAANYDLELCYLNGQISNRPLDGYSPIV